MGRYQVGEGVGLDFTHEGQGAPAPRRGGQGLRGEEPAVAGPHRALRQVLVTFYPPPCGEGRRALARRGGGRSVTAELPPPRSRSLRSRSRPSPQGGG